MSAQAAYGSEQRKQALLEDIRTGGPVFDQALTPKVIESGLGDAYRAYDIHPALLRLLAVLGGFGQDEEGRTFYVEAFEALPVGHNPLNAIRDWFLAAADHPIYGFAAAVEGLPMETPARAILNLVRQSLSSPIDKATWRKARSALIVVTEDEDSSRVLADPFLSMAWDLEQNPGAAADVANAWGGPIFVRVHQDDDDQFTETENNEFMGAMRDFHERAMASVGEVTPGDDVQYRAYQAAFEALWTANPPLKALKQRSEVKGARVQSRYVAWRCDAAKLLKDCLRRDPNVSTT